MRTLQALLGQARRTLRLAPAGGSTDGQLLNRFRAGDDAAFELLVWRHGPMVLGVCRRILGDEHAAEDAFQTTFLALAQKCDSIGRGEAVGAWLYRVAYRTALRARVRAVRRAERERAAGVERAEKSAPDPFARLEWSELRPRLDAEVERLPAEYRSAFILCHLEGKTNEEAARELGCPVGTIQSRLSRARARLRARLRKQGLGPDSIPFIFFIQRPQAPAELSAVLVSKTVRPALATRAAAAFLPPRRTPSPGGRRWLRRSALVLLLLLVFSVGGTLAYAAWQLRNFGPTGPVPLAPPSTSAGDAPTPACSGGCHLTTPGAH